MRKRKPTTEELRLLDSIRREQETFERWYVRMHRASSAMHKSRVRLARLKGRLRKLEAVNAIP